MIDKAYIDQIRAYVQGLDGPPASGIVIRDAEVYAAEGAEIKGPLLISGRRKADPPAETPKDPARPKSIIEGVTAYFRACPLLKDGAFRIDALGDEPTEYAIDVGVFDPVIESYIDGSSDRRYQVNFSSREAYDLDRLQNIANSKFYEDFSEWVRKMDAVGDLPALPEGCTPETIRALSSGYLFSEGGQSARYQIQIELTYHKDA